MAVKWGQPEEIQAFAGISGGSFDAVARRSKPHSEGSGAATMTRAGRSRRPFSV